jgi:hypothetical protein
LKIDAVQQKWLVRLSLNDKKISLGQNSILKVVRADAKEIVEVNAILEKV